MMEHSQPEHICSSACPDYNEFTLVIVKLMDGSELTMREWHFMFNDILLGQEMVVENEHITIAVNNARLLAQIITKLNNEFSSDFHISEYAFSSINNSLRVELGEI